MARLALKSGAFSPSRMLIASAHPSAHPKRRIEIVSTGIDEALQSIGSDPFGSLSWVGLRVPSFVTTGPQNRYLFMMCSFEVADGDSATIIGLRHGYSLGVVQSVPGPRPNELWVKNPIFKPPFGNVSWHLHTTAIVQMPNPGNGPIQPPLQNFAFRNSGSPALTYLNATNPLVGFYVGIDTYTPPNRGMPYGNGITPEFGTFYDLKTDWQDASDWSALDIPVVGPCRVQFWASVQQTPMQKPAIAQPGTPLPFPLGESAEEQFLANFPAAQIFRVAGALAVEFESGIQFRSMIDHPSQWTDRELLYAVLQELREMNAKGGAK